MWTKARREDKEGGRKERGGKDKGERSAEKDRGGKERVREEDGGRVREEG